MLEQQLQSLSSNATDVDSKDKPEAVERVNRATRTTSGQRHFGRIPTYTGSDRSRTRGRLRQRPGAVRKPQKGGRQRGRNRGRKFRGKGKNRMRIQQSGRGSGRKLKSKNSTMSSSEQEQADAAYNAPPTSDLSDGSSSDEGREEMTNTLEPADGHRQQKLRPGVEYQRERSCAEMRCQRGGHCVIDDRHGTPHARCQCPLGTKGRHCETGPCPSCYTLGLFLRL